MTGAGMQEVLSEMSLSGVAVQELTRASGCGQCVCRKVLQMECRVTSPANIAVIRNQTEILVIRNQAECEHRYFSFLSSLLCCYVDEYCNECYNNSTLIFAFSQMPCFQLSPYPVSLKKEMGKNSQ